MDNKKPKGKRRGRKPKNKPKEKAPPKKRGRKPKKKDSEATKERKKRGRKPQNKSYGFKKTAFTNYIDTDNIIVHLPIKDIDNNLEDIDNLLHYSPNISLPEPINDDNNLSFINYGNKENDTKDESPITPTEKSIDTNLKMDMSIDKIKCKRVNEIESIKKNLKKNSLSKTLIQFEEANKINNWPTQTRVACWWCTYQFDNTPCGLPINYSNNKYNVTGVFCSPECAAAYNFNTINNNNVWDKYSLLNLLYGNIYKQNIKIAPPRTTLKKFGGCLTIDQFRENNANNNYNFKVIMPPIKSIIPNIEYSISNKGFNSRNKQHTIDKKTNEKYKLKRNKPFNTNTLEECMNIIKK